tara:strand:+ start:21214 stop:21435 length:222 start_codon:yes stop_codon:yes gene_type:complete
MVAMGEEAKMANAVGRARMVLMLPDTGTLLVEARGREAEMVGEGPAAPTEETRAMPTSPSPKTTSTQLLPWSG